MNKFTAFFKSFKSDGQSESHAKVRYSQTDQLLKIVQLEKELRDAKMSIAVTKIHNILLTGEILRAKNRTILALATLNVANKTISILRETQKALAHEIQNPRL